jgi:hypothetical protein
LGGPEQSVIKIFIESWRRVFQVSKGQSARWLNLFGRIANSTDVFIWHAFNPRAKLRKKRSLVCVLPAFFDTPNSWEFPDGLA